MDHSIIDDHDIVVRYVQGKLEPEEAARFEEHYFDCPECLDALELTQRLDDGLKDLAAEEATRIAQATYLEWLVRRGRRFQSALALALVALVVAPWLILTPQVSRLSSDLEQATSPQAGAVAWRLSAERSAADGEAPSAQIVLGEAPEWVTLTLEVPPFPEASRYLVRVASAEGASIWRSEPLDATPGGTIDLRLHSSWLSAGTYRVELEAPTSDSPEDRGLVSTYFFGVRGEIATLEAH